MGKPPITRTIHRLPFLALEPKDFERLVMDLVTRRFHDAVLVGDGGSDDGCDISASTSDGRRVAVQCKRMRRLEPADAVAIVERLASWPPDTRPHLIIVALAGSMSKHARDRVAVAAAQHGLAVEIWTRSELEPKLRQHPELIEVYFGGRLGEVGVPEVPRTSVAVLVRRSLDSTYTDPMSAAMTLLRVLRQSPLAIDLHLQIVPLVDQDFTVERSDIVFGCGIDVPDVDRFDSVILVKNDAHLGSVFGALTTALSDGRALDDAVCTASVATPAVSIVGTLPHRVIERGEPRVIRTSPALAGRASVDFSDRRGPDMGYLDWEPFVRRDAEMASLLVFPWATQGDGASRFVWVHGAPGMGKSALLRHYTSFVRDAVTHHVTDPPLYVLHITCSDLTRPEEVERAFCERVRELYCLPRDVRSAAEACDLVAPMRARHVWVLDDVTYAVAGDRPDLLGHVRQIVTAIRSSALASGLSLQMIISARWKGPAAWEHLPVGPLGVAGVQMLAQQVAGGPLHACEIEAIERLYTHVRSCTAYIKRALLLALDRGSTFSQFADELVSGQTVDRADEIVFSTRMMEFELLQLGRLEERDGFRYIAFLHILQPLIARVGYFTCAEFQDWFGTRFLLREDPHAAGSALQYLNRLGILRRTTSAGEAFTVGTSQALPLRAIARAAELPKGLPLRGHVERFKLALELHALQPLEAIFEIDQLLADYAGDVSDNAVRMTLFGAHLLKIFILAHLDRPQQALAAATRLVRSLEKTVSSPTVDLLAPRIIAVNDASRAAALDLLITLDPHTVALNITYAAAVTQQIFCSMRAGRGGTAVRVADKLAERYRDTCVPEIRRLVAYALSLKTIILASRRDPAALAAAEQARKVVAGDSSEQAAAAMLGVRIGEATFLTGSGSEKGAVLRAIGEEAKTGKFPGLRGAAALVLRELLPLVDGADRTAVYDQIIALLADDDTHGWVRAAMRFDRAVHFGNRGEFDAEVEAYRELVAGEDEIAAASPVVARALVNLGHRLAFTLGRTDEGLAMYGEVIRRFERSRDPEISRQAGYALHQAATVLFREGRRNEGKPLFERFLRRIDAKPSREDARLAVSALFNLACMAEGAVATAIIEKLLDRARGQNDPEVAAIVCRAHELQATLFWANGRLAESAKAFRRVLNATRTTTDAELQSVRFRSQVNLAHVLSDDKRWPNALSTLLGVIDGVPAAEQDKDIFAQAVQRVAGGLVRTNRYKDTAALLERAAEVLEQVPALPEQAALVTYQRAYLLCAKGDQGAGLAEFEKFRNRYAGTGNAAIDEYVVHSKFITDGLREGTVVLSVTEEEGLEKIRAALQVMEKVSSPSTKGKTTKPRL